MNVKTYELNLAQLEEAFSKSKNNKYADNKKKAHFEQLSKLFQKIKDANYSSFSTDDLIVHNQIFNYLYKGLEFLDDSTLNSTPYEIVTCLSRALKEWIDDDNFIIVTSLSNKIYSFSLESIGAENSNQIKKIILDKYGQSLDYRLIKINLPKLLVRDYLSCVVLYHELGHFIDAELNVSNRIFIEKYNKLSVNTREESMFLSHTKEYFADLFAAQYVSNSSNIFLNHIAFNQPDSLTHPATQKRIQIVENFLNSVADTQIKVIQETLKKVGVKQFGFRFKQIDLKDNGLINLVPQQIKSDSELHAIFKLGWDIWLQSDTNYFRDFSRRQRYYIVNNLIEKSISNYNVLETWNNLKK